MTASHSHYTSVNATHLYDFWNDKSSVNSTNISTMSFTNGITTVPSGVYLASYTFNFERQQESSQYYQVSAGIMKNETSANVIVSQYDESALETGTAASLGNARNQYGQIIVNKIITVSPGDTINFYTRTYYLNITITTSTFASLT